MATSAFKIEGDSLCSNLSCRKESTTPIVHLRGSSRRRSFLRGMRQGGEVTREMSSGNQVRVGQCGATSRTCSSSSLSLHSVCASRLTGGNTSGSGRTRGKQTGPPELPRIDSRSAGSSRDGVATVRGM